MTNLIDPGDCNDPKCNDAAHALRNLGVELLSRIDFRTKDDAVQAATGLGIAYFLKAALLYPEWASAVLTTIVSGAKDPPEMARMMCRRAGEYVTALAVPGIDLDGDFIG